MNAKAFVKNGKLVCTIGTGECCPNFYQESCLRLGKKLSRMDTFGCPVVAYGCPVAEAIEVLFPKESDRSRLLDQAGQREDIGTTLSKLIP